MKVVIFLLGLIVLAIFNGLCAMLLDDVLVYLAWCVVTGGLYGYFGTRLILQD